jgi:thiol-disulfide isomerase/thioredoxin
VSGGKAVSGPTGARRAAVLAAALAFLALTPAAAQQGALRDAFKARFLGKPAPPFALKDLKGRTVRLADQRGKVVLLNFWYSACGPCRMETPDLISLHQVHRERGLVILGINLDQLLIPQDEGRQLASFLSTFKVPYPVLVADMEMYKKYGSPPVQPVSFLIDHQGNIARLFWGAFPGAAFDRAVRPLLAAAAAPPSGAPQAIPPAGAQRSRP